MANTQAIKEYFTRDPKTTSHTDLIHVKPTNILDKCLMLITIDMSRSKFELVPGLG